MNCFEIFTERRVRFWIEIYWMHQITNSNNYELSNFGIKKCRCVTFWTKTFNVSSFQIKSIQRVRLWIENFKTCQILKKFVNKKSHIESCYFEKTACFAFSLLFWKASFWNEKLKTVCFFELKNSGAVHFDVGNYQRVKFWILKNQLLCSEHVFYNPSYIDW